MPRAGSPYPQVEPGALGLAERRVVAVPRRTTVMRAVQRARSAGAEIVLCGRGCAARRRDLERAHAWGLGAAQVAELAWHDLPTVGERTPESEVRGRLIRGVPLLLVARGPRVVGAVDAGGADMAWPSLSLAPRLEHPGDRAAEAGLWLLRLAGKVGEGLGSAVFAVGGLVRDLLLGRPAPDVDLLVEGDAVAFSRRLAEEVAGSLVIHGEFGTAAIEGAVAPGGVPLGRVDVAGARRERYAAPGALPAVSPGPALEDLARRDFTVNAMALSLQPSTFGRLLDPLGGQRDLRARCLRVLTPLSFVEDPTRIFRAARYAARLGLRLEPGTRRALRLALRLRSYPALSGQRLRAEVELLADEPRWVLAFEHLLRWRALSLWHSGFRIRGSMRLRLADARRLRAWARREGIGLDPGEIALIALLLDQPRRVREGCLDRLAVVGEPRARLSALGAAGGVRRALAPSGVRRSRVAEALAPHPLPVLVAAWLGGSRPARRRIEWYLARGRAVRPALSGEDLLVLGVPRGPAVGECLRELRRRRLDGALRTREAERRFVTEWIGRRRGRDATPSPRSPGAQRAGQSSERGGSG